MEEGGPINTVEREVTDPSAPLINNITINNRIEGQNPKGSGSGTSETTVDGTLGIPGVASLTAKNILKGTSVVVLVILILLVVLAVATVFIVRELKK